MLVNAQQNEKGLDGSIKSVKQTARAAFFPRFAKIAERLASFTCRSQAAAYFKRSP